MSDKTKGSGTHYQDYLGLSKLLDAQQMKSEEAGDRAHDEMLFIIVHQVYELWFKQILHELESIVTHFDNDEVDEKSIGIAVARLNRVTEILKLLIEQIPIMETMTPLDFLEFRHHLFPASGFQSYQFRKLELILGLEEHQRVSYNSTNFKDSFCPMHKQEFTQLEKQKSLLRVIEKWLERTPFLQFKEFDFLEHYGSAVDNMILEEKQEILTSPMLNEDIKQKRMVMLEDSRKFYNSVLDPKKHKERQASGQLKISYKATIAALLINLYRDEPILHLPFQLLSSLLDIDEFLTTWRYRHAQMVLRMLGRKIGTGGSSGYEYLHQTAAKHHIFMDFHNISTLLIPRSKLPALPAELKKQLGFYFSDV